MNDSDNTHEDINRPLRPLLMLELLTQAPHPVSLAQLTAQLKAPKSTLLRLLEAMEARGYVRHMPADRGYVAGTRTTELALKTLQSTNIRRDCRAVLRKLVEKLGETCNLTAPDGGQVRYIEREETREPLRMVLEPGARVPMHCTASGKLFLASMPLLERRRVMDQLALERLSPNTITDRTTLEKDLQVLSSKRIGLDNEEFVRGMVAIAVPICARDGRVVAAVACHAPTARRSLPELLEGLPRLRLAADALASVLMSPLQ